MDRLPRTGDGGLSSPPVHSVQLNSPSHHLFFFFFIPLLHLFLFFPLW